MSRALFLTLLVLTGRPAAGALCAIDPVPAATLLYPFFEVDLGAGQSRNTILSVANAGDTPVIAHFTLWTDWAVPVLTFDVYLAPYDRQALDLAEVLVDGRLPVTGAAISPHHAVSEIPVAFPGCNNGTTPGSGPVYADPALSTFLRAELQDALTGQHSAIWGGCVGSDRGDAVALGYVTVDANDACTLLFPSTAGYFDTGGPTSRRNVLIGDLVLVRDADGTAPSLRAVPLEAAAAGEELPGGRTFYARYVGGDGSDGREPLPTRFEARRLHGGVVDEGTTFYVWRETVPGTPGAVACGTSPAWAPLDTEPVLFFDEQENPAEVVQDYGRALTLRGTDDSPFPFGRADVDLQHAGVTPLYGEPAAQGWLAWIAAADGRFALPVTATHYPLSCTP
jgi:hypothetical protein